MRNFSRKMFTEAAVDEVSGTAFSSMRHSGSASASPPGKGAGHRPQTGWTSFGLVRTPWRESGSALAMFLAKYTCVEDL
jgi:hypothetical protein